MYLWHHLSYNAWGSPGHCTAKNSPLILVAKLLCFAGMSLESVHCVYTDNRCYFARRKRSHKAGPLSSFYDYFSKFCIRLFSLTQRVIFFLVVQQCCQVGDLISSLSRVSCSPHPDRIIVSVSCHPSRFPSSVYGVSLLAGFPLPSTSRPV